MNLSKAATIVAGLFLLLGAAFAFNETGNETEMEQQQIISPAPQGNTLDNLWASWEQAWTTPPLLQIVPAAMVVFMLLLAFLLRNILPIKFFVLLVIIGAIIAFVLGWVKL